MTLQKGSQDLLCYTTRRGAIYQFSRELEIKDQVFLDHSIEMPQPDKLNLLSCLGSFLNRLPSAILNKIVFWIFNRVKLARFVKNFTKKENSTFAVVIAMPFALHLVLLCCRHLRQSRPDLAIVVISNGISQREYHALLKQLCLDNVFNVTLVGKPVKHEFIIDTLINFSGQDFWLVDHDCLVFKGDSLLRAEEYSRKMRLVGAAFYSDECQTSIGIIDEPHTFLLFIRPSCLKKLMISYRVSSAPVRWDKLCNSAKITLASLGFNAQSSQGRGLHRFETLAAVSFLALADNIGFYQIEKYSAYFSPHYDTVHFGNTSRPIFKPSLSSNPHHQNFAYIGIGAYFWLRCLDVLDDASLRESYRKRYPDCVNELMLRDFLLKAGVPLSTVNYIDSLFEVPVDTKYECLP